MLWQRSVHYNQEMMQDHLAKCFGKKQLVHLPHEARTKRRRVYLVCIQHYQYPFTKTSTQNTEWTIVIHGCVHDIFICYTVGLLLSAMV